MDRDTVGVGGMARVGEEGDMGSLRAVSGEQIPEGLMKAVRFLGKLVYWAWAVVGLLLVLGMLGYLWDAQPFGCNPYSALGC